MDDITTDTSTALENALPDQLDLELREPIKLGEVEFTTITLTEPTTGQLIEAGKATGTLAQIAKLVSLNGKVPTALVNQVLQRDLKAAADFFARFGA